MNLKINPDKIFSLVIQSFGRENEYRRTVLTVMSFYSFYEGPIDDAKVLVFTDKPEWFASYFIGLPITFMLLTPEKIKAMRGNIDFLHRMKIAVIEEAFQQTGQNILYADSDTFFIEDPRLLMDTLTPGNSYMHIQEYPFAHLQYAQLPAGKTFVDFLNLIKNESFQLPDGSVIKVDPQLSSWNAGVILLHRSHQSLIPDVYALTEQFYPPTKNHASEQYAFSIVLQTHTDVKPCDRVIYHYWYIIKKKITDQFLQYNLNTIFEKKTLTDKLALVKTWTAILQSRYKSHEWTIRDNAIQAFNENKFREGYKWAIKALIKKPLTSGPFLKDTLYHLKRQLSGNG